MIDLLCAVMSSAVSLVTQFSEVVVEANAQAMLMSLEYPVGWLLAKISPRWFFRSYTFINNRYYVSCYDTLTPDMPAHGGGSSEYHRPPSSNNVNGYYRKA